MSHHNANTVVKHTRCHYEKIKGVILTLYRPNFIFFEIKFFFSFYYTYLSCECYTLFFIGIRHSSSMLSDCN